MKTRPVLFSFLSILLLLPVESFGQAPAPGYAVTDFATGFAYDSNGIGPIGLAFDASDNLFIFDAATDFCTSLADPAALPLRPHR